MYYIRNDIGKYNHCTCIVDSKGEVLIQPFFFTNNSDGFHTFLQVTKPYCYSRHLTGLEATGHYGDYLTAFLLNNGYQVGVMLLILSLQKLKESLKFAKLIMTKKILYSFVVFYRLENLP